MVPIVVFNRDHLNCLPSVFNLLSIGTETPLKIGRICKLDGNLYDIANSPKLHVYIV